jgi:quercetin dioxygenase-like cupin family protein
MARVFTRDQLPHFSSTRDTRDRLDLIKGEFPVEKPRLYADRIIYHPGDTAAKHYHIGSQHVFVALEGEGNLLTPEGPRRLKPGYVAILLPEEIHWFENDTPANFTFVEFWAPPPAETIWVTDDV